MINFLLLYYHYTPENQIVKKIHEMKVGLKLRAEFNYDNSKKL